VASAQYNYLYSRDLHYPYSVACLLSYARAQGIAVDILPCAVYRDDLAKHIELAATADVLLVSCYVWNEEISHVLAREAKRRHPSLRVVFGGPQIPNNGLDYLTQYPYVDTLVHGEAEGAIVDVLRGSCGREVSLPRLADLSGLPSPYLTGVVEQLAGNLDVQWVPSWETNRGCPYQCTFCDWGSATYTKLRQFPMERLINEIQWFADRRVGYIDCCDANFGMLPRDLDLAKELRAKAAGITFRQSWAKNSSEKVIAVAQELKAGGLLTAVGLAVQSLDEPTLQIIKRKNLPFERFSDLTKQFADAGLPTYTEVIRGLPGETLESFKRGLGALASDSRIGTIAIYNCGLLPNAPMADPAYRAQHKIEVVRSPIYLAHSSSDNRAVPEYEEIVVSTATMSREDMHKAFVFSWAILVGESLGLLRVLRQRYPGDCVAFYDAFLDACATDYGSFGQAYLEVMRYASRGYQGLGWDAHDPLYGDVLWPIEELTWLKLTENNLEENLGRIADRLDVADTVDRQVGTLAFRSIGTSKSDWARETMWYGRRRGRFLRSNS
jgi:radical SAM superfamily enzyme YgiQ (UPF0313 family)